MQRVTLSKEKVRILSLDGGGVRGWLEAGILAHLEAELAKIMNSPNLRIVDYFDIISGTSTGGLLTGLLCHPKRYSCSEIQALYVEKMKEVFSRSWLQSLGNLNGLEGPKYTADGIDKVTKEIAGTLKLSDITKPILLGTYDLLGIQPMFLSNRAITSNGLAEDFYLADAMRATSSAPTYFPPASITSLSNNKYIFVDGGMTSNSPALTALLLSKKIVHTRPFKTVLVSLGAGDERNIYTIDKLEKAGKLGWVQPLINILIAGQSSLVDWQCAEYFSENKRDSYFRLNPVLSLTSGELDDCSAANMAAMQTDLQAFLSLTTTSVQCDAICRALTH